MATQVNTHQAKIHFSQLVALVKEGEEIIIVKAGKPVARLVPVGERLARLRRVPGSAQGQLIIKPDFDDPLPLSVFKEFGG